MAAPGAPLPRMRRRLAAGAAVCALLAGIGLATLWAERNTLGARWAVDYLRRLGVPAAVTLTRLDARAVEGSLRLGPPGAPALVVEHFRAEFAPPTGLVAPRLTRLRLVRPRLDVRWDGRRLDLGALQPLVDDARRAPPGGGPAPDVDVLDGRVRVHAPQGMIEAAVDAAVLGGALKRADLRLAPTRLAAAGWRADTLGGVAHLRADGAERLLADFAFEAASVGNATVAVRSPRLTGRAALAYRPKAADPWAGPLRLAIVARAKAVGGPVRADAPVTTLVLDGRLATARPSFAGAGTLEAATAHLSGQAARAAVSLDAPSLRVAARHVELTGGDLRLDGDATARAAGGAATGAAGAVRLGALGLTARGGAEWRGGTPVRLSGEASLAAEAGVDRRRAAELAQRAAPGPYGADLRPALSRALTSVRLSIPRVSGAMGDRGWRVALAAPARIEAAGGGRLTLAAGSRAEGGRGAVVGAGALGLTGGGFPVANLAVSQLRVDGGYASALVTLAASGSAGPARGVRLAAKGALALAPGRAAVRLSQCADVALERLAGDGPAPLASAVRVRVCAAPGAPAFATTGDGWRVQAELRDASARAPGGQLAFAEASGRARFEGRAARLEGELQAVRAQVTDTTAPLRFRPLRAAGALSLRDQRWTGGFDIALAAPAHPLGRLTLAQDVASGAGSLALDAPNLIFAVDGLQPAAVTPGVAALGRDVAGPLSVRLDLAWRGAETTSRVRATTSGLDVRTPAGLLKGVRTDLVLTALAPLASPPGQRVTADRLEAVTPLTDLHALFTLGGDALDLAEADAELAGGRVSLEPMRIGLLPGAVLQGVAHADGVELGRLVDALNLSQAVKLEARVGGRLPFSIGPAGVRFTDGRLAAQGPGRLTLRREALTGVATGAAPGQPPSAAEDFALQALEDLAFSELDATVASRAGGRLGIVFHVKGRHDPAVGRPPRVGLLDLLRGRAFQRSIPLPKGTEVNLTLDTSLNFDELMQAYGGLAPPAGSAQVQPAPAKTAAQAREDARP